MHSVVDVLQYEGGPGFWEYLDTSLTFEVVVPTITVPIDIKPGSDPNSINSDATGLLPVAILGSESFDIYDIDSNTITLGGQSVAQRGSWKAPKLAVSYEDVNDDTYVDLVVFFNILDLSLDEFTTELMLEGQLTDGTPIEGTDSVRVVPP